MSRLDSAGGIFSSGVLRASALMLLSTVCFASMHGIVRHVSADVHPFEISFFRNLFGMLVLTPWFVKLGLTPLRTAHFRLHLLRAALNVVAMLLFFLALSMTPLAQVQALGFTAPMFTTLLAIFILRESVGLRRWSAMLIGFVGALLVLRPGIQPLDAGSLLTLASSAVWGLTLIFIKVLVRTESAVTITAYMVILMTPLSLPAAWLYWTWPSAEQLAWFAACALTGTLGQMLMTQAFRLADASLVLPLDFAKIVWGSAIGYLFFAELVDGWTWLGAIVIFSGAMYITYRERQLERATSSAAGEA